ncbi:MAG TPA: hypothetical protein VF412_02075 [Bdellovibrio sp.]|uniref:hypothetical protein n=1 Tax=Bdellovibrio sp. TaxID=28201 RepID=UPI002F17283C
MKAVFAATAILFSSLMAQAEVKTLLYCKNIAQGDLKYIVIRELEGLKPKGIVELQEFPGDGSSITRTMTIKDYKDGYISISKQDSGDERTLVRRNGHWEVLSIVGDYKAYSHADCEE